jgi:hypothetical protein
MITINDPTIEQIREVRHQISQDNDHDPDKLINYYLELQKKYKLSHQIKLKSVEN